METVEILIRLPKGYMELINDIFGNNGLLPHVVIEDLLGAISLGTVLPRGHGRLIDADSIYQIVRPIEQSDAEWGMTAETAKRLMHDVFNKAPTIIEADKENANADSN